MSRSTHHGRPSLIRRVGVACALAAALVLCPLPASGGWLWDAGIAIGYAALVTAATLYLYPLRSEGLPHRRLFTLSQHRRLGWIALVLALLHAAALLVAQPQVGHYLLPSAPLYMLLGLAALIALAILVATGLSARTALRKAAATRTPPRPPTSVSTHAILAALLLALTAAHLLGSHQLFDRPAKVITLCALLALPLLWAAFRITLRNRPRFFPTLLPSVAAAAILFLLPIPTAKTALLQPATAPALLPVYFPHEKHRTVACVTCHHNFVDKTGLGSCRDCHRSTRPDLPETAEATFHNFCRDCHTALAQNDLPKNTMGQTVPAQPIPTQTAPKHGPTRACSTCHTKDPPPPTTQSSTDSQATFSAAFPWPHK